MMVIDTDVEKAIDAATKRNEEEVFAIERELDGVEPRRLRR